MRPAGHGRIAGREENQVIQVGAREANRAFVFDEEDPGVPAQFIAAFRAD
jgi:hypothetical protein